MQTYLEHNDHVVHRVNHDVDLGAFSHAVGIAGDDLVDFGDSELPPANLGVDAVVNANLTA